MAIITSDAYGWIIWALFSRNNYMSASTNQEDKGLIISQIFLPLSFSRHVLAEGTLFLTVFSRTHIMPVFTKPLKYFAESPGGQSDDIRQQQSDAGVFVFSLLISHRCVCVICLKQDPSEFPLTHSCLLSKARGQRTSVRHPLLLIVFPKAQAGHRGASPKKGAPESLPSSQTRGSCSWTVGLMPFSLLFRSIHCHVQARGRAVSGCGLKPFLFGSGERLLSYASSWGLWWMGVIWPIRMQVMTEKYQRSACHTLGIQKMAATVFVSHSSQAHQTLTFVESNDGI
uniref:uncharacterized protein LOC118519481 n=1 Tax=Halichoerus grypus TaxID=9711 RepID=UPI0016599A8F|nr:uncharacterized protein LOC118519481 [Halichoerus grypus]